MDEREPYNQPPKTRRRTGRSRRLRITGIVSGLIAILTVLAAQTAPDAVHQLVPDQIEQVVNQVTETVQEAQPGTWQVTHVVDGDTINVTQGSRKEVVRLLGIDTPETHDPRKPVQCFGETAAAYAKNLLEGKNVRLEPDPTDSDRDKYNRLLRYVYLPDGTLVNTTLVRDGYAFAYTIFPLTKLDELRALEVAARTANRGLWAGCNVDDTKQVKQTTSPK